jgi:4-hydroxyphenylpyruvate dioxygenase-like putative hemolysin
VTLDRCGQRSTRFDHLSQSMQYEEMLTWLLFYTSLLDLRKAPIQDVIDQGDVVRIAGCESARTPSDAGMRQPGFTASWRSRISW